MFKARVHFPELTLVVERDKLVEFMRRLSEMRSPRQSSVASIGGPAAGSASEVELVAGSEPEEDLYTRTGKRLTLVLSPEAVELLLFKLEEFKKFGSTSTPEFQEFHPTAGKAGERLTLRVFLALNAKPTAANAGP